MAVAKVQSNKIDPVTGSSIALALSGSPVAGNSLLAFCNFSEFGASRTITTPANWTKLEDVTKDFVRHAVFWHLVVGGDGTSWPFTISEGTQPCGGEILEVSGADTVAPTQHGNAFGSGASLVGPSLTPGVLSMLVVAAFTKDNNQIGSVTVDAAFTIDQTSGGPNGRGGVIALKNALTADLVTAVGATWTQGSGADSCIASMVLIAPPGAFAKRGSSLLMSGVGN